MFPAESAATASGTQSWMHKAIRKTAIIQLAVALCLLAGTAAGFLTNFTYWQGFIHGPVDAARTDLQARNLDALGPRQFLHLAGDKTFETGLNQITTTTQAGIETSKQVTASYYILRTPVGGVVVKGKHVLTEITGRLVPMPPEVEHDIFGGADGEQLKSALSPWMLDASDPYRESGSYALVAGALALGFGAWLTAHARQRLNEPEGHPSMQWALSTSDPRQTEAEIEHEVQLAVLYKGRGITVTHNYVLRRAWYSFRVYPLDDLLWAYKRIVRTSVYFVPVGKSNDLQMMFRGGSLALRASSAAVDNLLQYLAQRAPWALFGYSEELKKLANNKTALRTTVDQRKGLLPG